jgi:hypothetical protein
MAWPTGSDYAAAAQNPRLAFRDPELKGATPELDQHGIPKPRSGSYAVAFKMQTAASDYAVRCFLKDLLDRQERYRLISAFLEQQKLPYMVTFQYLPEGILALGTWRPMLKMEWVHGESLGKYIEKRVNDPAALLALAGRWVEMTRTLATAGMAHGDLQHGNVIITPRGQIKLIDYDGMYVPALAGRPSDELGQRNFQHPLRTALDFGPTLDHFSEWVIYLSLVLIAIDPALWSQLRGGDDCLLFRQADFQDPDNSAAFRVMESARDRRVVSLAEYFRTLLYYGVSQVPLIESGILPMDLPEPVPAPPVPAGVPSGLDWVKDHLPVAASQGLAPTSAATTTAVAAPAAPPPGPSWVIAMTGPLPAPAHFDNPTTLEWLLLVASAATWVFFIHYLLPLATAASALLAAMNLIVWILRYRQQEVVERARASAQRVAAQRRELATAERALTEIERQKSAATQQLQQRLDAVGVERRKIQESENREGEKPQAQLKLTLAAINDARKRLADSDAAELRKLQHGLGSQLLTAQRALAGVDQDQLRELAATLEQQQRAFVSHYLNSIALYPAVVQGIGSVKVADLRAHGIATAADMNNRGLYGIPGIGPKLQGRLLAWAKSVEAAAMRARPTGLSRVDEDRIKSNYAQQRATLSAQRDDLQKRMAAEQARINSAHQAERDALAQQERDARARTGTDLAAIHAQYVPRYKVSDNEVARLRFQHVSHAGQLDQDLTRQGQQVAAARWQLARLEHENAVYAPITVHGYVRRAVWPFAA